MCLNVTFCDSILFILVKRHVSVVGDEKQRLCGPRRFCLKTANELAAKGIDLAGVEQVLGASSSVPDKSTSTQANKKKENHITSKFSEEHCVLLEKSGTARLYKKLTCQKYVPL